MILDKKITLSAETNKADITHSERAETPSFRTLSIPINSCSCNINLNKKAGVYDD